MSNDTSHQDDSKTNGAVSRRNMLLAGTSALAAAGLTAAAPTQTAHAQPAAPTGGRKPNILVLWGDDIGWWNISAYNHGSMGYKTPNIDRIIKEGAMFTDWYGQQSCTAGRAAFITGQTPYRTGLLKVGLPGAKEGLQKEDVTIAELLKAQGYMCRHFLVDRLHTLLGQRVLRGSGTNVRCLMTSLRSSVTVKKNRSAVTVPLMVGAPTRFAVRCN
jgi:hypothetical protein